MIRSILAFAFVLVASVALAQSVSLSVDKHAIPGLGSDALFTYDLDGNDHTREFVQMALDPMSQQYLMRSISTANGICISPWFNPWNYITLGPLDFFVVGNIMEAGDRYRFTWTGQQTYGELSLMPASCTN